MTNKLFFTFLLSVFFVVNVFAQNTYDRIFLNDSTVENCIVKSVQAPIVQYNTYNVATQKEGALRIAYVTEIAKIVYADGRVENNADLMANTSKQSASTPLRKNSAEKTNNSSSFKKSTRGTSFGITTGLSKPTWTATSLSKKMGYFVEGEMRYYWGKFSGDIKLGLNPFPSAKVYNVTQAKEQAFTSLRINLGVTYYFFKGKPLEPYVSLAYGSYTDGITAYDPNTERYSLNSNTTLTGFSPRLGAIYKYNDNIRFVADLNYHGSRTPFVGGTVGTSYYNVGLGVMYLFTRN